LIIVNVFKCDPDSTGKPGGQRVEMDAVGMRTLLRAGAEVQRLKRHSSPTEKELNEIQSACIACELANGRLSPPSIEHSISAVGLARIFGLCRSARG